MTADMVYFMLLAVNYIIYHEHWTLLWQRATPIIVGWFTGSTWKNITHWHT